MLLLIGFLGWQYLSTEIFSQATLARLTPGLTTNQVAAILGPPSQVLHGNWVYERPLKRQVGLVYFDYSGKLEKAFND